MADYSGILQGIAGYLTGRNEKQQRREDDAFRRDTLAQDSRRVDALFQQLSLEDQKRQDAYELGAGQNETERMKVYQADVARYESLLTDPTRMADLLKSNAPLVDDLKARHQRASLALARTGQAAPPPPGIFSQPGGSAFGEIASQLKPRLEVPRTVLDAIAPEGPTMTVAPLPVSEPSPIFNQPVRSYMQAQPGSVLSPGRLMVPGTGGYAPVREETPQNVVVPPPTFAQLVERRRGEGYALADAERYANSVTAARESAARSGLLGAQTEGVRQSIAREQEASKRADKALTLEDWKAKRDDVLKRADITLRRKSVKNDAEALKLQNTWNTEKNAIDRAQVAVGKLNAIVNQAHTAAQRDAIYAEIQQSKNFMRKEDVSFLNGIMKQAFPTINEAGIERPLRDDELTPEVLQMRSLLGDYLSRRSKNLGVGIDSLVGRSTSGGTVPTGSKKPSLFPKGIPMSQINTVVAAIEGGSFNSFMKNLSATDPDRARAKQIYLGHTGKKWSPK